MKNFLHSILFIAISITLISCQKTVSMGNGNEQEYYNGYHYGEKIAKQDAIKHACTGTIENPSSNVWFQKRKYLGDLKETKSNKYIKGFLGGYESSFEDHMRLYCGDALNQHAMRSGRSF